MRQAMSAAQCGEWAKITEQVLQEGLEKKAVAPLNDIAKNAQLINLLWMGALLEAIITRNVEPLRLAIDHISENLAPAP